MSVQPLFDMSDLVKDVDKEIVIELDGIKKIEKIPTITIKINDSIRTKQQKLFRKHNDFVLTMGSKKKGTKQEGRFKQDKLAYASALIDLCVVDSYMLFEKHDQDLLKKVFVRQPSFMDYVVDKLTEVFEGDLAIDESIDEDDKKK